MSVDLRLTEQLPMDNVPFLSDKRSSSKVQESQFSDLLNKQFRRLGKTQKDSRNENV